MKVVINYLKSITENKVLLLLDNPEFRGKRVKNFCAFVLVAEHSRIKKSFRVTEIYPLTIFRFWFSSEVHIRQIRTLIHRKQYPLEWPSRRTFCPCLFHDGLNATTKPLFYVKASRNNPKKNVFFLNEITWRNNIISKEW